MTYSTVMKVSESDDESIIPAADTDAKKNDGDRLVTTYGSSLRSPILGKHFPIPGRSAVKRRIELDTSLSFIPVYVHLKIHDPIEIKPLPMPLAIVRAVPESSLDSNLLSKTHKSDNISESVAVSITSALKHNEPANAHSQATDNPNETN